MTSCSKPKNQVIDLRTGGDGAELTYPLSIIEHSTLEDGTPHPKDISSDTIKLSLGTGEIFGAWLIPANDAIGQDATGKKYGNVENMRTVQLFVGVQVTPLDGTYYLWSQVADTTGETIIRRHQKIIVRADA